MSIARVLSIRNSRYQQVFSNSRGIILFVLFLLCFHLSFAQKPKLGLVLSGGGAKGIAHVTVLKEMEAAGLKPDYITGTSMGSIIGGLYAIGYSADQIEDIILEIDWDQILSNNIPMNYISYEEKEYYNRFLIELPVEKGKINLPSGVIEGQMLSEALNHYTWPAMKYSHFDELPIPFRCIGTDVSTGEQIIFEDGSLAEAMRASMAIPTAFSAADLDSTLAVDGGVVNNFPADVLKDMGADIIIGVNVTKGFKSAEEVHSMTGILMQMAMLSSNQKLPEQEKLCDVYIQPDMTGFSNASFSKYMEILDRGRVAAEDKRKELNSVAQITGVSKNFPGITVVNDSVVLSDISFTGNDLFNDDVVNGKLNLEKGDTVSLEEVEEGVRTVFGINGFYKVEYRLKQNKEGTDLKLKMKEKPPMTLRSSFHYDNTFSAGIVLNIQMRDLLFKSSRTILAGDVSEHPRFRFDYYKYIGVRKRAALNVRYDYHKEQIPIYQKGNKSDIQTDIENSISVNILTTQSLKSSYFLGINYETNRFKSEFNGLFPSGLDYGDFTFTRLRLGFNRNTLNNQNYPTKGTETLLMLNGYYNNYYKVKFINSEDSLPFIFRKDPDAPVYFSENSANEYLNSVTPGLYGTAYVRSTDFIQVNKKLQVIPVFAAGLILGSDSVNTLFNDFVVGGHQQVKMTDTKFIGLNYAERFLENFAIGGLFLQNVILKNFYLQYGANVLFYHDYVPIDQPSDFDLNKVWNEQTILGYGGELTYKSFIGPISLGVTGNTNDGYVRFYFALGYSFNYSD